MAKVAVALHARCLVDNRIREAGEVVQVDEVIANAFGKRVEGLGDFSNAVTSTEETQAPPAEEAAAPSTDNSKAKKQ